MTAGAREPVVRSERANGAEYGDAARRWAAPPGCVITADGTYGARLARDGESWYPERWTLDGPEPYAVPLPGPQPEQPGAEVLPLTDGRVLIHRVDDGRHAFSLLYPTGPGTGELPLGAVECPDAGTVLRLLPPAPDGERAYALAVGRGSTAVWLVAGGAFGPEHLAEVPGHCSGGVWLDGTGRLLALDRFQDGRTKSVVVDLERGGEVSPLLQIAEHSNDRLLLADADSGLLLIRSDAPSPGRDRLGWGVLGSTLPVRFPDCLNATGCSISPFAIQPGQVLTPESCAVALRMDGPGGTWVGVWRPAERRIHHRPAPEGWLPGTGLWTAEGVLRLPYVTGAVPCGVARLGAPEGTGEPDTGDPALPGLPAPRPVPLQQAPLRGGPPAGSPHPAPGGEPRRALPVHLTPSSGTARAPRDERVRAVDGPGVPSAGTGSVAEGQEPLSTVTSLTSRTSPGEAQRRDTNPGLAPGGALPPVVRLPDERGEPVRPVARRTPEPGRPGRPQPSRWTRVPLPLTPEQSRRAEPPGTPATEAGIWIEPTATPAPEQDNWAQPTGTPTQEQDDWAQATGAPAHEQDRWIEPAGTPTRERDRWAQPTEAPAQNQDRWIEPAGTPTREQDRWAQPTGAPTQERNGWSEPAAAPAPEPRRRSEPVGAPAPEQRHRPEPVAAPAPERRRRAESAGAATTEAGLWTKVAETPPPGMGLRTRTDGTLPGGMTVAVEPAEPLPPATAAGTDQGTVIIAIAPAAPAAPGTEAPTEAGAATEPVRTEPARTEPTPIEPGLWTKVAETPPPGMSLGAGTGATPAGGTVLGAGSVDALPAAGEFRGQVALRPLTAVPRMPAESGVPSVLAHTDEEKRGSTGEETSPSDSRAMTAR